ncbi:hypothetical protein Leryth_002275 [Lithospermum erythrorhizon]|nr:hypothetical protein Leryth_002275 [Lithospermum erythrorhizon]
MDGVIESSESKKKWVISGISFRSPLKKIHTKLVREEEINYGEECCTTPTSEESKISTKLLVCPPAPKKRKASSRCNNHGAVVRLEFFTPPDLETVFKRHAEKA